MVGKDVGAISTFVEVKRSPVGVDGVEGVGGVFQNGI